MVFLGKEWNHDYGQYIGGHWYYMNADGIMVTGRHYINKRWYYFNANGVWN